MPIFQLSAAASAAHHVTFVASVGKTKIQRTVKSSCGCFSCNDNFPTFSLIGRFVKEENLQTFLHERGKN